MKLERSLNLALNFNEDSALENYSRMDYRKDIKIMEDFLRED